MKALKIVVLGMILFLAGTAQAQLSVRFSIGTPPSWGPEGYSNVRYYYLPDVQSYYDVESSMFIYFEGSRWIRRSYLPSRYRNYDLYNGYKVVMKDYHGTTPYSQFSEHKRLYSKGFHREPQRTIGERPGRGNYSSPQYRQSNQVNRGRTDRVINNRANDDRNYDKRGNSKNSRNERSKGNDKGKKN
ncbi:MAG: hypothetical protein WCP85_25540 [Mariniphaga sp.]